jgi:hypothetical protein
MLDWKREEAGKVGISSPFPQSKIEIPKLLSGFQAAP